MYILLLLGVFEVNFECFFVISGFIKNPAVVKELTNMRYAHEHRINKFKSRCEGFISQIVALAACGHLLVPSSQAHARKGTLLLISNSSLVLKEHFPRDDCKHYQQWSTLMKFDSTDESADSTGKISTRSPNPKAWLSLLAPFCQ